VRAIATNGTHKVKSPKFKTSKATFKWLTPFYIDGYKITIVENKRKKFK
jgi:hypothetical protein